MRRCARRAAFACGVALSIMLAAADAVASPGEADLHVAVASNFATAMKQLATTFRAETGFTVEISSGSTGKLYAQIVNGAPYDVFLSADAERPERLVREGLAAATSLTTYAVGRLVLVSHARSALVAEGEACDRIFLSDRIRHFAIANPRTAPYGAAAEQTLRSLGVWDRLLPRLVRGENIAQTFQFVESGNAQAGLVAESQLHAYAGDRIATCRWEVPAERHRPIEQKAVVLRRAADRPAASAFQRFLESDSARSVIGEFGYER